MRYHIDIGYLNDSTPAHLTDRRLARHLFRLILVLAPLLLLAGCGGSSSNNAKIRVLNVSQDYDSLDLFVGSSATTANLSAVTTGTVSSYATVAPGSDTVYFTVEGYNQSDALSSETETFTAGEYRTYVTYGDNGDFGEYEMDENESAPSSGNAKINVVNTATDAGALDVYLTSAGASLASVSPNVSDLAVGNASGFSSVAAGNYELTVTGTGDDSDVRLQISSVTLSSGEVVTIVVTESVGGYLVNADILPQQGSLTTELNPDARVRAVVGLSSGSDVSATFGSTTLLSDAPITSIGDYKLVPIEAGSATVTVNGVTVSSTQEELAAGEDYTLLIYDGSGGMEESWLVDTNRLPASGEASIRLIDGMDYLTDPLSLSVNYVPIATDISEGTASSYNTGVAAGANDTLTVIDSTTSAGLYSATDVTLASQAVYTLFMFGSSSSPTAVLHQDR